MTLNEQATHSYSGRTSQCLEIGIAFLILYVQVDLNNIDQDILP